LVGTIIIIIIVLMLVRYKDKIDLEEFFTWLKDPDAELEAPIQEKRRYEEIIDTIVTVVEKELKLGERALMMHIE
jgi:hypothetical protein